ncbi:hypothetical protein GGX14DRAFT_568836 [Mycena pura]|uniref:Uncharacterized protein n=1 Tax=Mycena pura TaxID=153505 RepID=A0AAD6Y7F4_9AGAR|nr:hypothetical protein GGX14DRAFT_568836 [Mycena pura]
MPRLSTLLNHPDCLACAVAAARPQILSRAAHAFCVGPRDAALKEHARYGFAAYPGLRIDATDNASRSKYHRLQYHRRQRLRPRVQPEHRQRNASAGADGAEHAHSPPETRSGSTYGSYKPLLAPLTPTRSVACRAPAAAVLRARPSAHSLPLLCNNARYMIVGIERTRFAILVTDSRTGGPDFELVIPPKAVLVNG